MEAGGGEHPAKKEDAYVLEYEAPEVVVIQLDVAEKTAPVKEQKNEVNKCGGKSKGKKAVRRAKKAVHKGATQCLDCGVIFANLSSFAIHARARHGHVMCGICGGAFASEELLRGHRSGGGPCAAAIGREPVECDVCGKKVKNLRHHKAETHGAKSEVCDVCGKAFKAKYLQVHKKLVHPAEDSPVVARCNVCGKTFKSRQYYHGHMKIHVERHPCQVCGQTYGSASARDNHHKKVHLGVDEKPYPCGICGKRFAKVANVRIHVRGVHEGARPFTCDVCGKSFTQSGSVSTHKRTVHKTPVTSAHN